MNNNNKYNSKQLNCSNCLYTRIKSIRDLSDDTIQKCDKCGRVWFEGRLPTNQEFEALKVMVKMGKDKLKDLAGKTVELINQGVI
jgi:hypothetical protein